MGRRLSETQTYTGEIVSFADRTGEGNITSLTVPFSPIQDLHGYDHPWPAGGGKNLLPPLSSPVTNKGVTFSSNNAGEYVLTGTATANADCNIFNGSLPAGTYTINGLTGASNRSYRVRTLINGTVVGYNAIEERTITVSESDSVTIQLFAYPAYGDFDGLTLRYQLESGSAVTDWTPYENLCPISGRTGLSVYVSPTQDQQDATAYAVDWTTEAGTVYGGTLDVVTGVLTVTHALKVLNGSEAWGTAGYANQGFYTKANDLIKTVNYNGKIISDKLKPFPNFADTDYKNGEYGIAGYYDRGNAYPNQNWIYAKAAGIATVTDFKTWLSSNPITVVYELATPLTYQLTPQEVETLVGENNIWADTGEEITVQASMPLTGFQGWLVKVGNEGSGVEIPLKWIRAETYSATPDQRMEWSAERDVTGYLWRQTVQNQPPKIEFNTRLLTNNEISTLNAIFKAAFTNEQQRKLPVQFYDMEKDEYWIWDCYMPDTKYTIRNVDVANKIVNYEETRYAFIGY